ncbi:MAG: hypothetical protein ACK5VP_02525, partial [Betaproteobacteria bacterium]
ERQQQGSGGQRRQPHDSFAEMVHGYRSSKARARKGTGGKGSNAFIAAARGGGGVTERQLRGGGGAWAGEMDRSARAALAFRTGRSAS